MPAPPATSSRTITLRPLGEERPVGRLRRDDQTRARGLGRDVPGDATEQRRLDPAPAVRTEHDKLDRLVGTGGENALNRVADLRLQGHIRAESELARELIEQAAGILQLFLAQA